MTTIVGTIELAAATLYATHYASATDALARIERAVTLPTYSLLVGRARRFTTAGLRERWAWAPRRWRQVTDDTGVGNPAAATAEKGRKYVEAVSEKIGGFLVDLARADAGEMYE